MSTVNIYNYEAMLLDFAEGQLSAKETNDLFDFLAAHPELSEDLDAALDMHTISDHEELSFSKKSCLLKSETDDFTQNLIIASLENVATQKEVDALSKLVHTDAHLEREIAVFSKMKIQADEQLVFSRKDVLLKSRVVSISVWTIRASVAAAAVLFVFLFNQFSRPTDHEILGIASNKGHMMNQVKGIIQDKVRQNLHTEENVQDAISPAIPSFVNDDIQSTYVANNTAAQSKIVFGDVGLNNNDIAGFGTESVEALNVLEARGLNYVSRTHLARFSPDNEENEVVKDKNAPLFIDLIAEQSGLVNTTYSFAGNVSTRVKDFAHEWRRYNSIELNVFGMRTTIHKPSWMNWRRQNVEIE